MSLLSRLSLIRRPPLSRLFLVLHCVLPQTGWIRWTSCMTSTALFASLVKRLKDSGHVLLAQSRYNQDFHLSSIHPSHLTAPSFKGAYYVAASSGRHFCPVVVGQIKEIIQTDEPHNSYPSSLHSVCLAIGFSTDACNELDTVAWNQLAELDFIMRRDAAENDCLLPEIDFGSAYKDIKHTVPWSTGPSEDSRNNRVFLRISRESTIVRSIPSHTVLASRSPPMQALPTDPLDILLTSLKRARIRDGGVVSHPADADGDENDFEDAINYPSESGSVVQLLSYHHLSVGDFVVALCDMICVEYPIDDGFIRVYILDVRGLNIVV
ncbi:hypothetical protein R3P38DRAFT_2807208 [Favolaschia claudopus]|uniref:Uncharacterized protein n=1 Tax=Favolaschia claudopus TaxID=2862362 RepID=A0AAV9ZIC4_9AGAR